jgi:cobalt-zinc-cadmium efflux system protein
MHGEPYKSAMTSAMSGTVRTEQTMPARALMLALGLTLGFSAVEALAGWWAGSLALLSDAGHMASDAASLGLAAFAAWAARRAASPRHSYGFGRAEVVAAFFNAAFMIGILAWIAVTAVQRLLEPQPVFGEAVIGVALAGLVVNLGVAVVLAQAEQTMNTRGALLHVMGDLLGSVAALLSGVVIAFTGWMPIDPLLSLFICALILFSSLRLLREALHALMEGTPLHLSLEEIGRAIAAIERVGSVHDLHVWTLSSDRIALSAHLVLDDMDDWGIVRTAVVAMLSERYGIEHVTLQPEAGTAVIRRSSFPPKETAHERPASTGSRHHPDHRH